ncbi:MAG TPA: hypothetical protein ENN55_03730 [Firmicutes bacterium]|nr:hypothetical protein [Bacillota bacterium]
MSLILAKFVFSGPQSLAEFEGTDLEGIYGIFHLKHPDRKVADYGVLYIGDTSEITEAPGFPQAHKKYELWARLGGGAENLYIGFCPTPGLMPRKKELIKRHLIYKYNPMGNK